MFIITRRKLQNNDGIFRFAADSIIGSNPKAGPEFNLCCEQHFGQIITSIIFSDPKYAQDKTLLRTLPVLAQLGFTLEQYQETMRAFAEKLNDPGFMRTPQNIAALFGECFPKIEKFENNAAWMAMTNATTQYTTLLRSDSKTPVIAKHMIYV